ncbi:MAG: 4Fe-4S dicluster domain-containing protein [Bacillota bacterium]|jgi:heterodisulfide reductase subunit C|nr:4Fe-4S dicluster domain-containing protein [Bacillota bacterium]
MRIFLSNRTGSIQREFQHEIEEKSKQNLDRCLGCGACTGGCPNVDFFDYSPREIIAMIKLGDKKKVLESETIWYCLGCYLCEERCPGRISIPRVMDSCREMSLVEGYEAARENIVLFHKLFLTQVARYGRSPETLLALLFNFKTKDYLRDADLGRRMFLKGKMKLFPERVRNREEIRSLFKEADFRGVLLK